MDFGSQWAEREGEMKLSVLTRTFGKTFLLICLLQPFSTMAQEIRFDQKYVETIKKDSEIAPLAIDSFGDLVDLSSGSAQFRWTDIDIPGNSELPVRLQRSLVVEDRTSGGDLGGFGVVGDIDIPFIKGIFSLNGWQVVGPNPNARCTAPTPPPAQAGGELTASDYWSGNWMHIPGEGEQALLTSPSAVLPKPSGGSVMMTKNFWAFACTSSTKNGYPGEGFVAISPKGEKYYFDWVVSRPYSALSKRYANYAHSTARMGRLAVYFLVSRIEDRFGNWVNYTYLGDKLSQITSNDGRYIQITAWNGNNIASVASSVGSMNYAYTPNSVVVTQPDASKWTYVATGALQLDPTPSLPVYDGTPSCPKPELSVGNYSLAVTQPSGATAAFTFEAMRHAKANVPKLCNSFTDDGLMSYQYLTIPNFSDTLTLTSKSISGPGMQSMQWSYSYNDGLAGFAWESVCANPPTPFACPGVATTVVRGPNRSYKKYTYGNMYKVNSGQLLQVDEGYEIGTAPDVQVVIQRSTKNVYMSASEISTQPFPNAVGFPGSSRFDDVEISLLRPLKQQVITQDGTIFTRTVNAFDQFARPTQVTKASSPAP